MEASDSDSSSSSDSESDVPPPPPLPAPSPPPSPPPIEEPEPPPPPPVAPAPQALTHYQKLKVDPCTEQEDVKRALKEEMRVHHQDKQGVVTPHAERVREAMDVFKNEATRRKYDEQVMGEVALGVRPLDDHILLVAEGLRMRTVAGCSSACQAARDRSFRDYHTDLEGAVGRSRDTIQAIARRHGRLPPINANGPSGFVLVLSDELLEKMQDPKFKRRWEKALEKAKRLVNVCVLPDRLILEGLPQATWVVDDLQEIMDWTGLVLVPQPVERSYQGRTCYMFACEIQRMARDPDNAGYFQAVMPQPAEPFAAQYVDVNACNPDVEPLETDVVAVFDEKPLSKVLTKTKQLKEACEACDKLEPGQAQAPRDVELFRLYLLPVVLKLLTSSAVLGLLDELVCEERLAFYGQLATIVASESYRKVDPDGVEEMRQRVDQRIRDVNYKAAGFPLIQLPPCPQARRPLRTLRLSLPALTAPLLAPAAAPSTAAASGAASEPPEPAPATAATGPSPSAQGAAAASAEPPEAAAPAPCSPAAAAAAAVPGQPVLQDSAAQTPRVVPPLLKASAAPPSVPPPKAAAAAPCAARSAAPAAPNQPAVAPREVVPPLEPAAAATPLTAAAAHPQVPPQAAAQPQVATNALRCLYATGADSSLRTLRFQEGPRELIYMNEEGRVDVLEGFRSLLLAIGPDRDRFELLFVELDGTQLLATPAAENVVALARQSPGASVAAGPLSARFIQQATPLCLADVSKAQWRLRQDHLKSHPADKSIKAPMLRWFEPSMSPPGAPVKHAAPESKPGEPREAAAAGPGAAPSEASATLTPPAVAHAKRPKVVPPKAAAAAASRRAAAASPQAAAATPGAEAPATSTPPAVAPQAKRPKVVPPEAAAAAASRRAAAASPQVLEQASAQPQAAIDALRCLYATDPDGSLRTLRFQEGPRELVYIKEAGEVTALQEPRSLLLAIGPAAGRVELVRVELDTAQVVAMRAAEAVVARARTTPGVCVRDRSFACLFIQEAAPLSLDSVNEALTRVRHHYLKWLWRGGTMTGRALRPPELRTAPLATVRPAAPAAAQPQEVPFQGPRAPLLLKPQRPLGRQSVDAQDSGMQSRGRSRSRERRPAGASRTDDQHPPAANFQAAARGKRVRSADKCKLESEFHKIGGTAKRRRR